MAHIPYTPPPPAFKPKSTSPPAPSSRIHSSLPPPNSFISPGVNLSIPVPPHLARDRAEAYSRGNYDISPTREDVHEFNWGWTARLPGGSGMHKAWHWGVGDGTDDYVPRSPPSGDSDSEAEIPPSWAGKAPHLTLKENTKSKKWTPIGGGHGFVAPPRVRVLGFRMVRFTNLCAWMGCGRDECSLVSVFCSSRAIADMGW